MTPQAAEPQVGQAFEVTIAAWDEFHNVVTTYRRTHRLHYSGAEASPSGRAPEYSATTEPTFNAGEATVGGFRFYRSGPTTLKVVEETTTHEGAGTFNVLSGAFRSFNVVPVEPVLILPGALANGAAPQALEAGPFEPLAGEDFEAKVVAWDEFHNPVTTYTRTRRLRYQGAENSPSGRTPEYSGTTEPAFTAGETTVGGFRFFKAASTTLRVTEEGTGHEGSATFTVKPAGAATLSLSANPAEATVGVGDELTIRALDPYGNLATGYGEGAHALKFAGAGNGASGKQPVVLDRSGAEEAFGQTTEINFTGAEAKVEGGRNGLMRLFKAEEAHLTVTDGTISNGAGLAIKVKGGAPTTFKLSAPAPAEPEANQASTSRSPRSTRAGTSRPATASEAAKTRRSPTRAPNASPSGKAPEYPASATTVHFKEGVGNANGIKLYRAGAHDAHGEGRRDRRLGGLDGCGGPGRLLQALRADPRRTRSKPGVQRHDQRARRLRQPRAQLRRRGGPEQDDRLLGPRSLALGQGARIPRVRDDGELQGRRRHGDGYQALPRGREHAHGEGGPAGRRGRLQSQGGPLQELRRDPQPRRTAGRGGLRSQAHRVG